MTSVRSTLAAVLCVTAVLSVVSWLTVSSRLASASSLVFGFVLVAWFANELRGRTSSGQRQIVWIGLLAGAVALTVAVLGALG